jgi:hypothetical protein
MANMIQGLIGSTGYEPFTIVPFIQSVFSDPPDCFDGIYGYQRSTYGTVNGLTTGARYRSYLIETLVEIEDNEYVDTSGGSCSIFPPYVSFALRGTGDITGLVTRNFFSRIEFYSGTVLGNTLSVTDFDDFVVLSDVATWTATNTSFGTTFDSFRIYY